MRSAADLAFHERLALDLLARDGPEIVWGLHLNAMEAVMATPAAPNSSSKPSMPLGGC